MKGSGRKSSAHLKALAAAFIFLFSFEQALPVFAATLSDLNKQKQLLTQQAEEAKKAAEAKQAQAQELKVQLERVSNQISKTEAAITTTESQISQTGANIAELEAKIKIEEANLAAEKLKMADTVSSWYMENQSGLLAALIGADSISEAVDTHERYAAISDQIEGAQDRINQAKADLNNQKSDKERQLQALTSLQADQENQKKSLESSQNLKNRLLNNTTLAISDLKTRQQQAQTRIAEIDAKIRALSATSIWGDQIVSSDDSGWYYTQTGNLTHLGDSPYTVSQYGCLITSIAMVATYYGHRIGPSDIASNSAIFSDDGYLIVSSPPGIGVTVLPSQGVNWSVIDQEIEAGRPVIISIYLPSVGAVNRDGSSHFIVIKGRSGSKYLMQDPIGSGRGYNISQARSMKLIQPN